VYRLTMKKTSTKNLEKDLELKEEEGSEEDSSEEDSSEEEVKGVESKVESEEESEESEENEEEGKKGEDEEEESDEEESSDEKESEPETIKLSRKEVVDPIKFKPGNGVRLDDIPYIKKQFQKKKGDYPAIQHLHKLIFSRIGKKGEVKKNLKKFSGIINEEDIKNDDGTNEPDGS